MKVGDTIKVIRMDDKGGKDWQASKMNGVVAKIDYIDDAGQVHLEGYGLALIPEVDDFTVIEEA
jgi:hypothetical protein